MTMKVELREELSTDNPDDVAAIAARGDYMEESVVGKDIDEVLQGVRDDTENSVYDRERALRTIHKRLLRRGHFGPYEHPQAFFAVEGISVACERQLTRHRHMSFDVQSMRYANFENLETVTPETLEQNYPGGVRGDAVLEGEYDDSSSIYGMMVDEGIPKEDARFVLPLGTPVNLTFSANSRALMHFIDMRHAGDAQWEIRELAERVLKEAKEWSPIAFEIYQEHAKGSSKKAP